jgi:hypothetical protein
VAADGAGLFRHAAENAADRVALFRRGCVTQRRRFSFIRFKIGCYMTLLILIFWLNNKPRKEDGILRIMG